MMYRFSGLYPYSPSELKNPLDFLAVNDHVLVCGSSGSGKSYLVKRLFPDPRGLVLFKPDALFPDVPLVSGGIGLPLPGLFEPYDVADAYLYALKLDMSGIMASSLVPVVMGALTASKGKGFDSFLAELGKLENDKIKASIVSIVRSHFSVLYPTWKKPRGRPSKKKAYVGSSALGNRVSFAGLGSFKAEYGAELFLRNLYSRLDQNFGVMVIDEFHHVAREGSIVDTLLREFRVSGQLVAITQSLSDVSPAMLSNFGHILLGRSAHPGDLAYLARLDSRLPVIVAGLAPRVFLDLTQYLVDRNPLPLFGWVD
jgi:hypothetical protein